ncbi:hypothetical protein BVC93_21905 [Mycobacterium sp. MS1601]|uniref:Rv1733c family protein n=1 Tax=Mycobacterium sp. MS1601 TaxID=1936029 RepID=UPI0009793BE3|nr:hypothetical protein [Mycobacterium sp. MS1601]AQA04634.1 hypothetical protein BVC93_21905 [Mycobacterium sp. MS1601]
MDTVDLNVKSIWLVRALGHNQLVRRSDRIEATCRVLAALVLVLFIPVACAVGTAVHETQTRYLAEAVATRHQVDAEVVEDSVHLRDMYSWGAVTRVRWTVDGRTRSDVVVSRESRKAGESLPIWVDRSGARTQAPEGSLLPSVTAVLAALTVWAATATVVGGLLAVQHARLTRRRYAVWEREYQLLTGSGSQH